MYKSISCHNNISFCADDDEHQWIVFTCRKGWDEYVGHDHYRLTNEIDMKKE